MVKIYHADANYPNLDDESKHRFIGEATFELANLLCSPTKVTTIPLFHQGDTNHKSVPPSLPFSFSSLYLANPPIAGTWAP